MTIAILTNTITQDTNIWNCSKQRERIRTLLPASVETTPDAPQILQPIPLFIQRRKPILQILTANICTSHILNATRR